MRVPSTLLPGPSPLQPRPRSEPSLATARLQPPLPKSVDSAPPPVIPHGQVLEGPRHPSPPHCGKAIQTQAARLDGRPC